jgi:hypothetical protein
MPNAQGQILEIDAVFTSNRSNAALGIGYRASGIEHWALSIEHSALSIEHWHWALQI